MSIGSFGILGSVASTPLAQAKSADQQSADNTVGHQRQVDAAANAEAAAGIGKTDGDNHEASERDADGRKLWENGVGKPKAAKAIGETPVEISLSKDASGNSGNTLDLVG